MSSAEKFEIFIGKKIRTPNQLLFLLLLPGEFCFMLFPILGFFLNLVKLEIAISLAIIVLIGILIVTREYIKNPNSTKFKYMSLIHFFIVFLLSLLINKTDILFIFGYIFGFFFFLYFDIKLVSLTQILISICNFAQIGYCIFNNRMCSGRELDIIHLLIQGGVTVALSFIVIIITAVSNTMNKEKMDTINQNQDQLEAILTNVMLTAEDINNDAIKGNEYMESLDISTENALRIFKDIASGNVANTKSVEEQAVMTAKISDLINTVLNNTNNAVNMTTISISEMNESKKQIELLRAKSQELMQYNSHILKTINDFVDNTNKVKTITEGIIDISSQTNLLSLNASIESARAGELGKGFAVVAEEIRNLSDQTKDLTANIAAIVSTLETNALEAKSVINNVVNSINDENTAIDNTVEHFLTMEQDMNELDNDMKIVLDSTEQVVRYNEDIVKHIEQLSAYTEELSASTQEALAINEENKLKTKNTKKLINNLKARINKLTSV